MTRLLFECIVLGKIMLHCVVVCFNRNIHRLAAYTETKVCSRMRRCLLGFLSETRIARGGAKRSGKPRKQTRVGPGSRDIPQWIIPFGHLAASATCICLSLERVHVCVPPDHPSSLFLCAPSVVTFRNAPACCLGISCTVIVSRMTAAHHTALSTLSRASSLPVLALVASAANMPARNFIQRRLRKRMRRAPQTRRLPFMFQGVVQNKLSSASSTRPTFAVPAMF